MKHIFNLFSKYKFVVVLVIIETIFLLNGCSTEKSTKIMSWMSEKAEVLDYQIQEYKLINEKSYEQEKLTSKEALDCLFEYLYGDGKQLGEVVFCDDDMIRYEWRSDTIGRVTYIQEAYYTSNGEYLLFELYNDLYSSDGTFIRTQLLNEFVINIYTRDIIECREFDEYECWKYSEDYYKYIAE